MSANIDLNPQKIEQAVTIIIISNAVTDYNTHVYVTLATILEERNVMLCLKPRVTFTKPSEIKMYPKYCFKTIAYC